MLRSDLASSWRHPGHGSRAVFQVDRLEKSLAKAGSSMRHPRPFFREADKLLLSLLIRLSLFEVSFNKDNVNNNDSLQNIPSDIQIPSPINKFLKD